MILNRKSLLAALAASLGLASFLACGGASAGKAVAPAPTLSYSNPTGSGWRLVKAADSTATHLVLELKAPAAARGLGFGLKLSLDERQAQWAKVAATNASFVANVAYDLGSNAPARLCLGLVRGGDLLTGVYQEGLANPVTYTGPVVRVAVDFKPGTGVSAGTVIPLLVTKANHVEANGSVVDLTAFVQVGILKIQ